MRNVLHLRTQRNTPDVVFLVWVVGILAFIDLAAMWAAVVTFCR
ncbi:hypothetical protein [Rhizobium sp. 768_B6_N1_8]